MIFPMIDMPGFMKKEIERLEGMTSPLLKKINRYRLWSFPLIVVSLVNLFTLMFIATDRSLLQVLLFAVLGAIGMALSKEAKFQRKEIHKLHSEYIIKRIGKSEILSETLKHKYISQIKQQPIAAIRFFITFLEEENKESQFNRY